ncbi:MAG: adenine phosphoribosyltransferase [Gaiellales bacterium]
MDLRAHIADIPDFPQPGILFRDLLPLLADPAAHAEVIRRLRAFAEPLRPDVVVGAEARGFLFGPTLAHELGCGFAPARKPGKLPSASWSQAYALEYGEDALELAHYAIEPGMRVLVHDDLLATGGTAAATVALARQASAEPVGACFVAELKGLAGRSRLEDLPVCALVEYEGA